MQIWMDLWSDLALSETEQGYNWLSKCFHDAVWFSWKGFFFYNSTHYA